MVRAKAGYDTRVDSLDAVDPAPLAGRRIALDPGHGGRFRGSLGVHGLAEADVNLAVALELRDLLQAHGAVVFMTRSTDRDFLTPADSSLRADLNERVRLANQFQPDLFVSIHHNADPGGAHDRNETQTYYKLGDDGSSLDAAASIHRYLRRNLSIEAQRILAGNYSVLRNSVGPAVLTEASYLTNPDVEARLSLATKRRLEAEALFLGLAHYFGRRAPVIEELAARRDEAAAPDTAFAEIAAPLLTARIAGAFDFVELTLDRDMLPALQRGDALEWRPDRPLAAGPHLARLVVRRAGSGAARARTLRFHMRRRPTCLAADALPERWAGALQAVRVRVLDEWGAPDPDSLVVRVRALTRGIAPRETTLVARGGEAWGYFRAARDAGSPTRARALGFAARLVSLHPEPPVSGACHATAELWVPRGTEHVWTGFVRAMPSGAPLRDHAPSNDGSASWLTRDGFAALLTDSAGVPMAPRLDGYRRWGGGRSKAPGFVAVAGGALEGRRIVLDPDGGGEDAAGMGPSGTRAAFYNLEVARALRSFLTAAGAEVHLARSTDIAVSDVERVRSSEAFRADRYLRIGHRPEPPRLGYYFSSGPGRQWARRLAAEITRFAGPAPAPAEDAQYPLQQASATALYASPARVDEPADEDRMNSPGALRAEAYALYASLLREWAPDAAWPLDSLRVEDAEGRPVPGAAVTLGDALVLETDAAGRVRFYRTEPGLLEVSVTDPRVSARTVLIDSDRGVLLSRSRR